MPLNTLKEIRIEIEQAERELKLRYQIVEAVEEAWPAAESGEHLAMLILMRLGALEDIDTLEEDLVELENTQKRVLYELTIEAIHAVA